MSEENRPLDEETIRRLKAYKANQYYHKNREKILAKRRESYKLNAEKWSYAHLRDRYKLKPEQYDAMVEEQKGRCYLCDTVPPSPKRNRKPLQVDHNHVTGKIRRLLCNRCNSRVAQIESLDNDWLNKALDYIEREGI